MTKETKDKIIIGFVLFCVGFYIGGDSTPDYSKSMSVLRNQVKSCQELAYGLDGLLSKINHDYEGLATDFVDLLEGNISISKFADNVETYSNNKDLILREYDDLYSDYSDKCFPKMSGEKIQ